MEDDNENKVIGELKSGNIVEKEASMINSGNYRPHKVLLIQTDDKLAKHRPQLKTFKDKTVSAVPLYLSTPHFEHDCDYNHNDNEHPLSRSLFDDENNIIGNKSTIFQKVYKVEQHQVEIEDATNGQHCNSNKNNEQRRFIEYNHHDEVTNSNSLGPQSLSIDHQYFTLTSNRKSFFGNVSSHELKSRSTELLQYQSLPSEYIQKSYDYYQPLETSQLTSLFDCNVVNGDSNNQCQFNNKINCQKNQVTLGVTGLNQSKSNCNKTANHSEVHHYRNHHLKLKLDSATVKESSSLVHINRTSQLSKRPSTSANRTLPQDHHQQQQQTTQPLLLSPSTNLSHQLLSSSQSYHSAQVTQTVEQPQISCSFRSAITATTTTSPTSSPPCDNLVSSISKTQFTPHSSDISSGETSMLPDINDNNFLNSVIGHNQTTVQVEVHHPKQSLPLSSGNHSPHFECHTVQSQSFPQSNHSFSIDTSYSPFHHLQSQDRGK